MRLNELDKLRSLIGSCDLRARLERSHDELFGWFIRDIAKLEAAIRTLCDMSAPCWESVSIDVHIDQHIYTDHDTHTATPEQVAALRLGVRAFYESLPRAWRGFHPNAKGWSHSLEVIIPLRRVQPHVGWPVIDCLDIRVLLYDVDLELEPGAGAPTEAILCIGTPSPDVSLDEDEWLGLLECVFVSRLWCEVVDERYTRSVPSWLDALYTYSLSRAQL